MPEELQKLLAHAGTAAGRLDSIQLAGSGPLAERLVFPASISWKGKGDKDSDGTVATFVATLTTSNEDREGDVLESSGAQVDLQMPLLWQHDRKQPIGKLLGIVEQSSERLRCRWAIADTPLGRDAATLAEFGALRMSHGFTPVQGQYEPRRGRNGYHIKRYDVFEGSLVSIPANVDARLEVFSRIKSFQSPEFQAMRAEVLSLRPAVVRSGFSAPTQRSVP